MPWVRKKFKKCKVFVLVDDAGNIVTENGFGQIKYQNKTDEKIYNAYAKDIIEIEDKGTEKALINEYAKDIIEIEDKSTEKTLTKSQDIQSQEQTKNTQEIVIYTDGACIGNPGPAGVGIVLICGSHQKEISQFIGRGTNNIAELTAIKVALESLKNNKYPVKIYTDSQYSLSVLDGSYKAKKNISLINSIKLLIKDFDKLEFIKVLGHSGVWGNERADKLANLAIQEAQNG